MNSLINNVRIIMENLLNNNEIIQKINWNDIMMEMKNFIMNLITHINPVMSNNFLIEINNPMIMGMKIPMIDLLETADILMCAIYDMHIKNSNNNMDIIITFLIHINSFLNDIYEYILNYLERMDNIMNNNKLNINNTRDNNTMNMNRLIAKMRNPFINKNNLFMNINDSFMGINNSMINMNHPMMNMNISINESMKRMIDTEDMIINDMRNWIYNPYKFDWNHIGVIEDFVDFMTINNKYFILTSIKHHKLKNKQIKTYFFISLYDFNTGEEINKIEVDNITNLNENNLGNYRNKFIIEKNNNIFEIYIEYNNCNRNYKYLFEDEQLIEI